MTAHTALHASQANARANKADDTSPFSALLESTAPKVDKTDKSKPKDKSVSDDDTKDTTTDTVKNDSKTDAKADAPAQADKSDKADKAEDTAKAADTAATDASQVAAPAQPVVVPPVPTPVAIATTPATAATDSDIEAVTDAADAAPIPQTDKTDKTDKADNTGKAAAAPQPDDQADDAATDAAAPQNAKGAPTPRKQALDAKPGKPDAIKADKPDTAAKPDAPQPDKVATAAADAPAPKPVQAATTNMAVHDITAPQAPQANAPIAPSITQHVQVAAQAQAPTPAPNMPALAIEISAKSQTGAKQFDIRLDPPELGRVEVRLSIDAAGKASAHLSADQPQTLDLLQKDSTSLMRALRDAGLDVSQDGLNFSLRQQTYQDGGAHQGSGRPRNFSLTATTSLEATATSAAYRRPADGRVDISV